MNITVEVTAIKDLLPQAQTVVILLPESANRDSLAGALGLYLSLKEMGKQVTIASPRPPTVGLSHLVGINKLVTELGNKNFVISLDYVEGSIEKVSYNIEGNKFNLVIEPRVGAPLINEKNVSYTYRGIAADVIITVGALSLESLGKYYSDNPELFSQKPVIAIHNNPKTQSFGKVQLVRPSASVSELIAQLIRQGEMPLNGDIASNLYDGITAGSRNFTDPEVDADLFDVAAFLLRSGARKMTMQPPTRQEELPRQEATLTPASDQPGAPPDWLKPKIYKGSSLL